MLTFFNINVLMAKHVGNDVLEKLREGGETAFKEVYDENREKFLLFARKYGLNDDERLDVCLSRHIYCFLSKCYNREAKGIDQYPFHLSFRNRKEFNHENTEKKPKGGSFRICVKHNKRGRYGN